MKKLFFLSTIFLSLFIIVNSCSDSTTESTPVYSLSVTVNPAEAGSVSPTSGEYEQGESVEITATANDGWMFDGWQGDHTSNSNPTMVTMSSDKQISARFVERTYPLTINTEGEGTIQERVVSQKTTEYEEGTVVELTAQPADGWRFVEWQGDLEGSENPATIEVDSEKNITAVFERRDYPLTVNIQGEGTVVEDVIQAKTTDYPYETNVQLTATATEGWVFARWEGDVTGSENPATVDVTNEKTVTAVFERETFAISYTLNGEGQITETLVTGTQAEDGSYVYESTVELTAEPTEGWQFTGWAGDLQGTDNPQTIAVDADKSITANFERKDYPLTINIQGEGTVAEEVVQAKTTDYPYETNVHLTANPAEGWVFSHWKGDATGDDNPVIIEITAIKNITAVFVEPFFLHENGVTIMCPKAEIGSTGEINGRVFTKRARNEINFENAASTCTSGITDMSNLFSRSALDETFDSNSFNEYITHWDVSSVTNMSRMFYNQSFNRPINAWDVSRVEDMSGMFYNSSFNQDIGGWDVSDVKTMKDMFYESAFNQNIGSWDVGSVTNMSGMFNDSPFNHDIRNWDVSRVTSMSLMFANTPFNQEVNSWNVSSVIDMSGMFMESYFNQDISNWDVSNVTDMSNMFATLIDPTNPLSSGNPTPFNKPIGTWNVSSVIDMSGMFRESHFNQEIGNWDVSNVADMSRMFYSNSGFDQDITNWNVSNVNNMSFMFAGRAATQNEVLNNSLDGTPLPSPTIFNQNIGSWNVSNVADMSFMFERSTFVQNINSWNVSNVSSMEGMFKISEFNNTIADWDVGSVANMDEMFNKAINFNQNISSWCVGSIYSEPVDFSTDSPLSEENKPLWGTCPD